MICPYRLQTVIQTDTNEEKNNKYIHVHREDYIEQICKKEECGAWNEGKCTYRGE